METKYIFIFVITLLLIAIVSFLLGKQFNDTNTQEYPQRGILPQDVLLKDYKLLFDPIETNTNSMAPTFGKGNTLIVSKDIEHLQVGDVIGFGDETFVTYHRIISIHNEENNWYAMTRGDNNHMPLQNEQKIYKDDIIFVVEGVLY